MIDATKMQHDDLEALVAEMRVQANFQEQQGNVPDVYIDWQRSLADRLETMALMRPNKTHEPDFSPLEHRWSEGE